MEELLSKLTKKEPLAQSDIDALVGAVSAYDPAQLSADPDARKQCFQLSAAVMGLQIRHPTSKDLSMLINSLRACAKPLAFTKPVLDIVGTGGDKSNTFNISTGSSILAAVCGIPIAKHGGRSVTSACGSADVLEELGVDILRSPEKAISDVEKRNMTFLFAPHYNNVMSAVKEIRKALSHATTIFNMVAPLINPSRPSYVMLGVYKAKLIKPLAEALQECGVKRAIVYHSSGLDEITPVGPIKICEVDFQKPLKEYVLDPLVLGFERCTIEDLKGGDRAKNAKMLRDAFSLTAVDQFGPVAHTLVLNAAVALWLYGQVEAITDGVKEARAALISGGCLRLLEEWRGDHGDSGAKMSN
eukprot:GHVU01055278.1.p1 GENE.GHVU01055278.1~~GHVU01055278.1.p1  ORF type:complete len:358 (+),score=78.59 GHVU01055278.1:381-1454(+)